MIIKFLGVNGGLCLSGQNRYNSNLLIIKNGKKLLIDCGRTAPEAIYNAGYTEKDIDAIYISHLHNDHVGGLEWMAFKRYFGVFPFGSNKPRLYANGRIIKELWNKTLRGGLESLQNKKNTLKSYFDVIPICPNGKFIWEDITFNLVAVCHMVDNREMKPSYGLLIECINGKKVFISTDTQFAPSQILSFYDEADIIFNDCEIAKYPQSVHAQYDDLNSLDIKYKKKMWLYHYDSEPSENDISRNWKEDGFLGFVKTGQEFIIE